MTDLHITNIAPTVTEIELRALFERLVPVASVRLLPGGDALVTFNTEEDAGRALRELDGSVLAGRVLSMRRALPRREREETTRREEEAESGPATPDTGR
jgi:RNA recognition motif-containing protein